MGDLDPILSLALRHGARQAEVFAVEAAETPVRFEANRLKEITSRRTSGVALRVIAGGRIGPSTLLRTGFVSSTRPGDPDGQAVDELVEPALYTPPLWFEGLSVSARG